MEPSIIRYGNDKKAVLHTSLLSPPRTILSARWLWGGRMTWCHSHCCLCLWRTQRSSQPWNGIWLNRFSVFTAGLPPSVHTSICLTRKGGQKSFEFPKQWMNFLSSGWIELQVAQYLFIGVCSVIFHWKMNAKTTVEVYRSLIYPLLLKKN